MPVSPRGLDFNALTGTVALPTSQRVLVGAMVRFDDLNVGSTIFSLQSASYTARVTISGFTDQLFPPGTFPDVNAGTLYSVIAAFGPYDGNDQELGLRIDGGLTSAIVPTELINETFTQIKIGGDHAVPIDEAAWPGFIGDVWIKIGPTAGEEAALASEAPLLAPDQFSVAPDYYWPLDDDFDADIGGSGANLTTLGNPLFQSATAAGGTMASVFTIDAVRGNVIQALSPDHTAQLGDSGGNLTVPSAAVANSDPAPRTGIAMVTIPAGSAGNIRIGASAVAVTSDQLYPGGDVYHFPIREGERVSIFGDAGGFTASVSMAR